jgi:predicted ATPase
LITKIEVTGFKSLDGFSLELNKGLNILVGPNGVGKSNIIQFFSFLSNLIGNPVDEALARSGGSGKVFRKIGVNEYSDSIRAVVFGNSVNNIHYEYSFNIMMSSKKDNVHFAEQKLVFKRIKEEDHSQSYYSIHFNGNGTVTEGSFNGVFEQGHEEKIEDFCSPNELKELSFFIIFNRHILLAFTFFRIFSSITTSGKIISVIPQKVAEQEDRVGKPEINPDGSGLARVLYAIKGKNGINDSGHLGFVEANKELDLNCILNYLKAANSSISNIDVVNDSFSNKLLVKLTIDSCGKEVVLPLSSMSDGTIKWLAIITMILTGKYNYSVEEPENFLHPWMQAEIVRIIRDSIENSNKERLALITTHSESLINACKPEEIILVSMEDGKTKAGRISNINDVKKAISNSGFGLGMFYFSGSLENE